MELWRISGRDGIVCAPDDASLLTTLNSDIYRVIRGDEALKKRILKNKICIDGRPIYRLAKLFFQNIELVQGSSLIYEVARYSAENTLPILIIGGRPSINERAVRNLHNEFGCPVHGFSPTLIDDSAVATAANLIVSNGAKYVFVCLGCPRQELFALDVLSRLPSGYKLLMVGAGGTVDFAAKAINRAPLALQMLHLEGLFRLMREPSAKRAKRLATSAYGLICFWYDLITKRIKLCGQ